MKPTSVYLVHLPAPVRELCQQAAAGVFPHARIHVVRSIDAALVLPDTGRQLLVLAGSNEAECSHAAQSLDAGELPRWAVVHLSAEASDLFETVPPEDWDVRHLSRIFRHTLMQHELLRENLQLRGDLKTVTRRVTHDARTPLGCVLTVCDALQHERTSALLTVDEAADAIRRATTEVSQLIDRVSFVLKASLDPLPPLDLAMGLLVENALHELRSDLLAGGKTIHQPGAWPDVAGVPAWIEFIWGQLIRNALRHGTRTGAIRLGWSRQNPDFRFWISSPGPVAAAVRPGLLRHFHLLHHQPSAGLGTSVIERLVALQGGQCGYEAAGDNTVFYFTLPAAHSENIEPMPRPPAAFSASRAS